MPPSPQEDMAQRNFAYELRFAIDTARKYPTRRNVEQAVSLARSQPRALRSRHVIHNLGGSRLDWLAIYGVYPMADPGETPGSFKETISPEKLG